MQAVGIAQNYDLYASISVVLQLFFVNMLQFLAIFSRGHRTFVVQITLFFISIIIVSGLLLAGSASLFDTIVGVFYLLRP